MDGFDQKVTRLAAKLMQQLIEMSSRQIDGKLSAQHEKILLQNKLIKLSLHLPQNVPFPVQFPEMRGALIKKVKNRQCPLQAEKYEILLLNITLFSVRCAWSISK